MSLNHPVNEIPVERIARRPGEITERKWEISETHWKCPWCGGKTYPRINGVTTCGKCDIRYLVLIDYEHYYGKETE